MKSKTLAKLKKECQVVFNKYIRLRDEGKPCISCHAYNTLQAGHYYSVGSYQGLRFDEDNVHGECARCNCFDESHLIHYGENIVNRIGKERLEALKYKAAQYRLNGYKFTRFEVEQLIIYYKQKIVSLQNK